LLQQTRSIYAAKSGRFRGPPIDDLVNLFKFNRLLQPALAAVEFRHAAQEPQ